MRTLADQLKRPAMRMQSRQGPLLLIPDDSHVHTIYVNAEKMDPYENLTDEWIAGSAMQSAQSVGATHMVIVRRGNRQSDAFRISDLLRAKKVRKHVRTENPSGMHLGNLERDGREINYAPGAHFAPSSYEQGKRAKSSKIVVVQR